MNVLRFLVGMLTMSFIVAISTYWATGSIWKATGGTVIALIVLQLGYFLYLLWAANRLGRGSRRRWPFREHYLARPWSWYLALAHDPNRRIVGSRPDGSGMCVDIPLD